MATVVTSAEVLPIAQPLTVTLTVEYPRGVPVRLEETSDFARGFAMSQRREHDARLVTPRRLRSRHTRAFEPISTGQQRLRMPSVVWTMPDGTLGRLDAPDVEVEVTSVVPAGQDLADLRDIAPPLSPPMSPTLLAVTAGVLLLTLSGLTIGAGALFRHRTPGGTIPPPGPSRGAGRPPGSGSPKAEGAHR